MQEITDRYIRRATQIGRAAEGEAIKELRHLGGVQDDIIRRIEVSFGDFDLSGEISALMSEYHDVDVLGRTKEIFSELSAKEIEWNFRTLEDSGLGAQAISNSEAVAARSLSTPYQGRTFEQWFQNLGATNTSKINRTLSAGYVNGDPISTTVANVKTIMTRESRDVRTLVRSSFQHSASMAKEAMFAQNSDIIDSKFWISTLDNRTTPLICGIRDGLEYSLEDNPVGHGEAWDGGPGRIHFNCRSTSIPKIKGVNITGQRPEIVAGDNYQRGDKLNPRGTVRKSTKKNRDKGIYDVNLVTTGTKYENWLRRQPKDFVDDALGSIEQSSLFRSGQIDLPGLRTFNPASSPLQLSNL